MAALCHESSLQDAASALARGDALTALAAVGRFEDVPALTLKGIAYAQMGDLELAKRALGSAARKASGELVRARISAALAEVTLGEGDAWRAAREAHDAGVILERLGDTRNAAMQELVVARADVLLGRVGDARRRLDRLLADDLDADVRGVTLLAAAEIAVREGAPSRARARLAEVDTENALLQRTVNAFAAELSRPIARLVSAGVEAPADLFAIERATSGDSLFVDACRRRVIAGRATVRLHTKPALFALLEKLARAWPASVPRDELAMRAFEVKKINPSHRSRMRVEIGRLRKELSGIAEPIATKDGYVLESKRPVSVLLPPADDDDASIALLLSDGAAWTAQAIADHANVSKRTVLRALATLVERGHAVRVAKGKDVRYVAASRPAIASRLLLLGLVGKS
jgi:hypothetical protein